MRPVATTLADILRYKFCSLLLQIVLPTRSRLTTRVWAFECLDSCVDPLMSLQVTARGEAPRAYLAYVRFGFAFCGTCRSVLSLATLASLGSVGPFRLDKVGGR